MLGQQVSSDLLLPQEAGRVLVLTIEHIIDPGERGHPVAEVVVGGESAIQFNPASMRSRPTPRHLPLRRATSQNPPDHHVEKTRSGECCDAESSSGTARRLFTPS